MNNLRVCVYVIEEHLEIINYLTVEPNWGEVRRAKMRESLNSEVLKDKVNLNLHAFQRIPNNIDGVVLLQGEE